MSLTGRMQLTVVASSGPAAVAAPALERSWAGMGIPCAIAAIDVVSGPSGGADMRIPAYRGRLASSPGQAMLKRSDYQATVALLGAVAESSRDFASYADAGVRLLPTLVASEMTTLSVCDLA